MYKYLNILVLLLAFSPAHATLFDVTWSNTKGSHWTGVVNTTNNTLVIDSWTTNDRIRQWWRLPQTESIIFDAVDINGDTFEIADDWDGTIGTDWGCFDVRVWERFRGERARDPVSVAYLRLDGADLCIRVTVTYGIVSIIPRRTSPIYRPRPVMRVLS